jgi:hypothetical protein
MSTPDSVYVPQEPPRKWVVSKTGYFWQERIVDTTKARPPIVTEPPSQD